MTPSAPRSPDARGYHELFEARGTGYDDAMARWPTARDEEFEFALELAEPQPGERVLDLPAGGGYLAERLPSGVEYLAVETASSFAARCRARGVAVIESDMHGLALPPGDADVILSIAGVHHEPDLGGLLVAWRRLVRPGGRVVIADVAQSSAVAAFLDGFVGDHNSVGHAGAFLGPDVGSIAESAGYQQVRVVDAEYHWRFDDEIELARYCAALFGLTGCNTAEIIEAARNGPGIETTTDGRAALRWGLRGLSAIKPESG